MVKKSPQPHLSLHRLLVALSYWGSAVRTMLFAIVCACTLWIALSHGGGSLQMYSAQFIYIVGVFVLFDAGYVTVARALSFSREGYDRLFFLVSLIVYAVCMIMPYYIALPATLFTRAAWVFLSPLFVLTLRVVFGLLFGQRGRQ